MSEMTTKLLNESIKLFREKGIYKIVASLSTERLEFTKEQIGREIIAAMDTEEEAFLRGWVACIEYWRAKGIEFTE